MRRLVERVQRELKEFVEQRDDLLCLVSCTDSDAIIVAKILEDIEQGGDTDAFVILADDFIVQEPYVDVAIERLREQHRIADQWLAEHQRPPLPPLPDALDDRQRPAAHRLFDAVQFTRGLLPSDGTQRLVWAMCPLSIADRKSYLELAWTFAPNEGLEAWMRRLRVVVRVDPDALDTAPELAECPRVRVMTVDFGPEAIENSLEEEAQDESLPEDERFQALLQVAAMDAAHERYDEAGKKYDILLGHYQGTGNRPMEAFVLNACGEMCHRVGDLDHALDWYERAVVPASEDTNAIVLATLVKNLADVTYQLERYGEAAEYYGQLDQLAGHLLNPELKATALEWRGLSLEQRGQLEQAAESWEGAATLCRNIGLDELRSVNLQHLRRVYEALGWDDRVATVRRELYELPVGGEG